MLYRLRALFLCLVLLNTSAWATPLKVNNNGSVTDLATGLIWQLQDDNISRSQAGALLYCSELSLAGNSSWRLPSIKELSSIVDRRTSSPAIDHTVFQVNSSSSYWSGSADASNSDLAWRVVFDGGRTFSADKTNVFYVRCVH